MTTEAFDLDQIPTGGQYEVTLRCGLRDFMISRNEAGIVRCFTHGPGDGNSWEPMPSGNLPQADESPLRDIFARFKGVTRESLKL